MSQVKPTRRRVVHVPVAASANPALSNFRWPGSFHIFAGPIFFELVEMKL
jgi:hypothetical protein